MKSKLQGPKSAVRKYQGPELSLGAAGERKVTSVIKPSGDA